MSEDFDTATATGKLQLTMVLAFSEWWRNSIRERSTAGQAKARAEGRFPGRRPSLNERQREYIRAERSKGVSQRELAKRLEVSRWTIQQVPVVRVVLDNLNTHRTASLYETFPAAEARRVSGIDA